MGSFNISWFLGEIVFYGICLWYFFIPLLSLSFEHYATKAKVPDQILMTFVNNLKVPLKWIFAGDKPLIVRILMVRKPNITFLEYFQNPQPDSSRRILLAALGTIPIIANGIAIFNQPNIAALFNYVFWIIVNALTLILSWRFGHSLQALKKDL